MPNPRLLIVGNGGREHALLWKLRRDAPDAELFVTRGNGGTASLAKPLPLDATDTAAIAAWAAANHIDLVVVGPEAPLDLGIIDVLTRQGVAAFGPTKAATAIEASKAYAKALMRRAGVPTAEYRTFTESDEAEAYIRERDAPLVVKASGLAAGKGAIVCDDADEAVAASRAMLVHGEFGGAGSEIVVEERLEGEEVSIFALCDGESALPMVPAQDYKRAQAGDRGPNTGGMGAYAPVTGLPADFTGTVRTTILEPTLAALAADERTFRGLLYAGLIQTADGPKVIEFNARFGDPETQALLPLVSSSLLEPLLAVARGDRLGDVAFEWTPGAALTTVLASGGYPGSYEKGRPIEIPAWIEDVDDVIVFHAGTTRDEDGLCTAGGRVLAVTAVADDIAAAATRSREAADAIEFEGKQWRDDIGWREIERQG